MLGLANCGCCRVDEAARRRQGGGARPGAPRARGSSGDGHGPRGRGEGLRRRKLRAAAQQEDELGAGCWFGQPAAGLRLLATKQRKQGSKREIAARGGRRKTLGIAAGLSRGAGRAGLDVRELTARRRERSVSGARENEGKRSRWPFGHWAGLAGERNMWAAGSAAGLLFLSLLISFT